MKLINLSILFTSLAAITTASAKADIAQEAFNALDSYYNNATGFYNNIEDWHNANILEQTANWIELGGDRIKRVAIIEKMYEKQIVNITCYGRMYNDDILWFVLGW